MVLIVVGAHLRAEIADRPLAYLLQQHIRQWLDKHCQLLDVPIEPVVCSDIWYLNNHLLQQRPTLCLGGPGVNALSAYLSQQLPEPHVRNQQVVIQIDPEFTDLRVCIWGTNHDLTLKGLDLFTNQYLEGFLRAVATQVEPKVE